MWTNERIIAVVIFSIIILVFIAVFARIVWKQRPIFTETYRQIPSYEKMSLQLGILLMSFVPLFESHPAKDSYVPKVLLSLMSEAGKALFIIGLVAFLQRAHVISNNQEHP